MAEETTQTETTTVQGDTGTGDVDAGTTAATQGAEQTLMGKGTQETKTTTEESAKSWLESLPDDLKDNETLKAYKDPVELAKALLEAKGKAVEVPETPDLYQVEVPENFPVDKDFLAAAKTWAHEAGLSTAQFEKFAKPYVEAQANQLAAMASATQKDVDALKAEWGPEFEVNDKLATQAVRRFGGDELLQALLDTGAAKKPAVVKAFLAIQKAISEDKLVEGEGENVPDIQYTQAGNPMLRYTKTPGMTLNR